MTWLYSPDYIWRERERHSNRQASIAGTDICTEFPCSGGFKKNLMASLHSSYSHAQIIIEIYGERWTQTKKLSLRGWSFVPQPHVGVSLGKIRQCSIVPHTRKHANCYEDRLGGFGMSWLHTHTHIHTHTHTHRTTHVGDKDSYFIRHHLQKEIGKDHKIVTAAWTKSFFVGLVRLSWTSYIQVTACIVTERSQKEPDNRNAKTEFTIHAVTSTHIIELGGNSSMLRLRFCDFFLFFF